MSIIPFVLPRRRPTTPPTPRATARREPARFDPPAVTQAERNDLLALHRVCGQVAGEHR